MRGYRAKGNVTKKTLLPQKVYLRGTILGGKIVTSNTKNETRIWREYSYDIKYLKGYIRYK